MYGDSEEGRFEADHFEEDHFEEDHYEEDHYGYAEFQTNLVGQVSLGSDSSGGGGVANETPILFKYLSSLASNMFNYLSHCNYAGDAPEKKSKMEVMDLVHHLWGYKVELWDNKIYGICFGKTLNHQSGGWGDSKSPQGGLV